MMKKEAKSPLLRKSIIGFRAAVARLATLVSAALCVDHRHNPLIMAEPVEDFDATGGSPLNSNPMMHGGCRCC